MKMKANSTGDSDSRATHLEHSAFPTSLSLPDVLARYWSELRKILPADELHVVDPYVLDSGGADAVTYAGDVTSLLGPALRLVKRVVFVHEKPRVGIRELIETDIALFDATTEVSFHRGTAMHSRYVVADRSRALRMEFSFNRIGKSFGTVSLVDDGEDLAGVLEELQRLSPAA